MVKKHQVNELDTYYFHYPEPVRGCMLALRDRILASNQAISPTWKWGVPFFYYESKPLCYLNFHKKRKLPYLAFMDGHRLIHPALVAEHRTQVKILLLDPEKDLPMKLINEVIEEAVSVYSPHIRLN